MVPEMKYEVKKMVFESFDAMIETTFRIKDVLREQGILAKNGNNNNNGQNKKNNKDKGKNTYWNKNRQVVNDGVVDSSKPKIKFFSIWLVPINKVTSQDIKKGLKERNVTLHNWVSHMKIYS